MEKPSKIDFGQLSEREILILLAEKTHDHEPRIRSLELFRTGIVSIATFLAAVFGVKRNFNG